VLVEERLQSPAAGIDPWRRRGAGGLGKQQGDGARRGRLGHGPPRRRGTRAGPPAAARDFLDECLGFGRGRDAKLAGKEAFELAPMPQRDILLARGDQEADDLTVGRLTERIGADRPPGEMERARQIPPCFRGTDHLRERSVEPLRQALSLWEDPVLVVTGEQLALVEGDGVAQPLLARGVRARLCRAVQKRLEPGDVRGDGGGVELHELAVREDHGSGRHARRLKLSPEKGERLAEAIATGARLALWPKQLNQRLPRMGTPVVVRQVGEQQRRLSGLKTRERTAAGKPGGWIRRYTHSPKELDAP
jgi:hypothetical protein